MLLCGIPPPVAPVLLAPIVRSGVVPYAFSLTRPYRGCAHVVSHTWDGGRAGAGGCLHAVAVAGYLRFEQGDGLGSPHLAQVVLAEAGTLARGASARAR